MDFTLINIQSPSAEDIDTLLENHRCREAREKLYEILKTNRDWFVLNRIFRHYFDSKLQETRLIRELVLKTDDTELIEPFCRFLAKGYLK